MRVPCLVSLLLCALLGLLACTPVPVWQRGTLMQRVMAEPVPAGEAAINNHVDNAREAMAGATEGAGASCGCN